VGRVGKMYGNISFYDDIKIKAEQLAPEKRWFFSWLCAVRALPFLNVKRYFKCWKKSEIKQHLQSIFYVCDSSNPHVLSEASFIAYNNYVSTKTDAIAAADAAYAAAAYAADAAAYAYDAYADAAYAANTYAYATAAYAYAAYASAYSAARAAYAAYENNSQKHYPENFFQKFIDIISDDIEMIRTDNYNSFNNDTSIYGTLFDNFKNDLYAIGCGYWADVYDDLFINSFKQDDNAIKALNDRLKIPDAVRNEGATAVASYMQNLERQGSTSVMRETRIIVLGSAGAGKTTLTRRLNDDDSFPAPGDSTHGVDTQSVLNLNGIKSRVWDFGGQVIYHSSHRCFLTENCIYILVVNARTEENRDITRINYWLDTIRVYSDNKAKVFMVINEADDRRQNEEDYNSFKNGEFGNLIYDIFSFNIGNDIESVNNFKSALANYIEATGHQVFGINDSGAMKEIKALFDQNKQIVNSDKIKNILLDSNIEESDHDRVTKLFNTLGVALSYDFMGDYVLDPCWISRGVYMVIDYLQKNKTTFINYNDLDIVFANERSAYPTDSYEHIFNLMDYYNIGFRNPGGIRGLIIPCAASQLKPPGININPEPDNIITRVERDDLLEFPADFFYKFICNNQSDIKRNGELWSMWQTGMVLGGSNASALVELKENRRIEITIWGEKKVEYQKNLEALINDLLIQYNFTSQAEERNRGGKITRFIILMVEAASKGAAKGFAEMIGKNFM